MFRRIRTALRRKPSKKVINSVCFRFNVDQNYLESEFILDKRIEEPSLYMIVE